MENIAGSLHNLIRIAIDGRHHRTWQPSSYAPIIQTPVFVGVSGTAHAIAARRSTCRRALCGFGRQRRNLAVGRIDDEPGLTSLCHVQIRLPPALRGMKRSLEVFYGAFLGFAFNGDELFALDVFELPAFKDLGTFQRSSILAGIRETSLQIGIAPWRSRRSPLLGSRRRGSFLRLCRN